MIITRAQAEKLLQAPVEDRGFDDHWDVDLQDDERLEVRYNRFALNGWQRFITPAGDVERWDDELGQYVAATFEPLEGQWFSRSPTTGIEIRHTYRY